MHNDYFSYQLAKQYHNDRLQQALLAQQRARSRNGKPDLQQRLQLGIAGMLVSIGERLKGRAEANIILGQQYIAPCLPGDPCKSL
jgi:hypothetical protein